MKEWLYWHFPIITTRWRKNQYTKRCVESELLSKLKIARVVQEKTTWTAINPVIHSLKELRKNTWDKERVDKAVEWLEINFEVEDDNSRHNR